MRRSFFGGVVSVKEPLFLDGSPEQSIVLSQACLSKSPQKGERVLLRVMPGHEEAAVIGSINPGQGLDCLKLRFVVSEAVWLQLEGSEDAEVHITGSVEFANVRSRGSRNRNDPNAPFNFSVPGQRAFNSAHSWNDSDMDFQTTRARGVGPTKYRPEITPEPLDLDPTLWNYDGMTLTVIEADSSDEEAEPCYVILRFEGHEL